ncbi:hypothetical protein HYS94_00680 [Candidatus Daviesbacteria bacterium]|nr:hypothetical protein [Candidatus Daviesbacteria bacterium]
MIFVKKIEAWGNAYFDPIQDEVVVHIKQDKLHPNDLEKLQEMVRLANKKLFIPHQYDWILDKGLKIVGIKPFTPPFTSHLSDLVIPGMSTYPIQITPLHGNGMGKEAKRSVVKVFLDLSDGLIIEREADGVYIAAEKIFDLNKPRDSFEDLVFRVVEAAVTFPNSQILFKLADMSEGMGKVRGTLRLLHQKSLLEPLICQRSRGTRKNQTRVIY